MKKTKVKEYVTKHKKLIIAMAATTTVACGAAVTYMLTRRTPSKCICNVADFIKGMDYFASTASWGTFREGTKLSELGKVAEKVIEVGKGEFTPDTEVVGAVVFMK